MNISNNVKVGISFATATAVASSALILDRTLYGQVDSDDNTHRVKIAVAGVFLSLCSTIYSYCTHKKELRERRIEARADNAVKPDIKIIGAGLSRTGTVSLQEALHKLGYEPIYHGLDMFADPDSTICWQKYKSTKETKYLYAALEGMNGLIDFPSSQMVEELLNEFPDAKVILTTREGIGWAKSAKSILFRSEDKQRAPIIWLASFFSDKMTAVRIFGEMYRYEIEEKMLEFNIEDENVMAEKMEKHNQKIRDMVPSEKLLELRLGYVEWKPLCEFLDKNIPDEPYPKVNNSDAIKKTAERILRGQAFDRTGQSY